MRTFSRTRLSALSVLVLGLAGAPGHDARATAQTPATTLDQQYEAASPALYTIARKYFPSDVNEVSSKRIFRLTRDQIDASVRTLLPAYFGRSIKETMPRDPLQTNYEFAEILSLNPTNITALSTWIREIAGRVQKKPAGLINCTTANNSEACLTAEARGFILKAFRGDATDTRIAQITDFYVKGVQKAGYEQATADLVEVVLNSPDFLFRKELALDKSGRLAPAQLLQALTYTIADVPPETLNLQSSQAAQYLRSPPDAKNAIDVMTSAPQSRDKLMRFFTAWLEIREPGEFTISLQTFPEFKPEVAAAMREDTLRFLRAKLSEPVPRLRDITQSTQAFAAKALDGLPPAPGQTAKDAPPAKADAGPRFGIFSQPAVLASHSGPTDTRPVKRGVFWVRKAMCMEMEPPPQDAAHTAQYAKLTTTERQRIEQSTRQASCIGCHKFINPLGFFAENYDALGRWRTFDNGHPVDATVDFNFLDEGPSSAENPVEALKTLTNSMMFKQCFVRQLFRFYVGRQEEPGDDPLLRRLFFEFAQNDNQDIVSVIQMLATSNRLVRRQ